MGLLDDITPREYYQGIAPFESKNIHAEGTHVKEKILGDYQFSSLDDIITQFQIAYVGEDKIISKVKRIDIAFFAQRALQELSFDTFKSTKAQEIVVPSSLQMILPRDYVNYTKISWMDSAGIKHLLYPTSKTSNPTRPQVDSNDDFLFDNIFIGDSKVEHGGGGRLIPSGNLITNGNFLGGAKGWVLNRWQGGDIQTVLTTSVLNTHGETILAPDTGWFYGYNGNAMGGYNLVQWARFQQDNVPIIHGEEYTITYTISNYTSGEFNCVIVDENGDYSVTTGRSANGTYTETITASNVAADSMTSTIYFQNKSSTAGNAVIDSISIIRVGDDETSTTWSNYKSGTPSENQDDYQDDTYWPADGERYGLDPQHAQANGSFYIDNEIGKIHFSSNISGKTVVLDYISDSLGTDGEMQVHKFAEEAMYKWISHAILAGKANIPEYQVNRFKKEKFAAIRQAKLRLSNIKLEELTQILRGKSKQIKH